MVGGTDTSEDVSVPSPSPPLGLDLETEWLRHPALSSSLINKTRPHAEIGSAPVPGLYNNLITVVRYK